MRASLGHSQSGIDPRILKEAAQWLTRLQTDGLDAGARAEWQRWKGRSTEHEQAWEKAERLLGMISTVPPELKATLDRPARLSRRQIVKAVVTAVVVGPATWFGYKSIDGTLGATYATDVGQSDVITLADGLTLALNTDTAVKVEQSEGQSNIKLLRGEMMLDTAERRQNISSPIEIATDDGWLRLRDGRVNLRRRSDMTETVALRGAAEILLSTTAQETAIRPGQQASFQKGRIIKIGAEPSAAAAWLDGDIFADDMRLQDFLDEVARYRHGYVICDPVIADLRISGSFQVKDTDKVLEAVQNTLPVKVEFRTRYWVSVTPAGRPPVRT